MKKIRIIDNQFPHGKSFGTGWTGIGPKDFEWYRGNEDVSKLIVFTESGMARAKEFPNHKRIGIILEPRVITPWPYDWVSNLDNQKDFDFILTYDQDLLDSNPEFFKFYPFGGTWLLPEEQKVIQKSKNVSIISSHKNYAPGHKLRHEVIKMYGDKIDGIYGSGYNFVETKADALRDYRFSIIIENSRIENYFSEKLIDCMLSGTIPIYWGATNIDNFFYATDAILSFSTLEELGAILEMSNEEYYNSYMVSRHMIENFKLARYCSIPENILFEKYFSKLI